MLDDMDLSGISDPEAHRLLGIVLERLRGVLSEQQRLLLEHQAVLVEQRALLVENAALREELARIGGPDWRNRLEHSLTEVAQLREERQRLRADVARLKGEQD